MRRYVRSALRSAGILPYRRRPGLEVLIAHPGGPFWAKKDAGAWSVIKGLVEDGEEPTTTAAREFQEETGWLPPSEPWTDLGEIRLRSGKRVVIWAAAGDYDPATLVSDEVEMRVRGRWATFPEIDRVGWFDLDDARSKLNPAYGPALDRLEGKPPDGG